MWLRATAKAGRHAHDQVNHRYLRGGQRRGESKEARPKGKSELAEVVVQEQPEGVADVAPDATAFNQELGEDRGTVVSEHQGALMEQAEPGAIDAGAHRKAH
jgi:hypothetical protein